MKTLLFLCVAVVFLFVPEAIAQKASTMTVCGDPGAACPKRGAFKDEDIPFNYTEGSVVTETAQFYAVIVKSAKLPEDADCEKTPTDFDRESIQITFQRNKVFVARGCYSIMNNFYNGLGTNVIALAVYAGTTKAQADAFLKKVKANDYFNANDAYVLRLTTGFNGT